MAPQNKKAKLDHTPTTEKHETSNNTTAEEEDAEPAWIRLEDLEEEDIDDEFGDMVIQQKLLVNNEVKGQVRHWDIQRTNVWYRMLWSVSQKISNWTTCHGSRH